MSLTHYLLVQERARRLLDVEHGGSSLTKRESRRNPGVGLYWQCDRMRLGGKNRVLGYSGAD